MIECLGVRLVCFSLYVWLFSPIFLCFPMSPTLFFRFCTYRMQPNCRSMFAVDDKSHFRFVCAFILAIFCMQRMFTHAMIIYLHTNSIGFVDTTVFTFNGVLSKNLCGQFLFVLAVNLVHRCCFVVDGGVVYSFILNNLLRYKWCFYVIFKI